MSSAQDFPSVHGLEGLYSHFESAANQDPEDPILPVYIDEARRMFGGLAGKLSAIPECDVFAINGGMSTVFASGDKHLRLYCGPESYIHWAEADGSGVKYSDLVNAPDSDKLAERLRWLEG